MSQSIRQTIARLLEHFYQFPELLQAALKERENEHRQIEHEAERLDRLRHPSNYCGK